MTPAEKLKQYEELIAQADLMESRKAALIDEVTPAEVKAEIDAIEAEITPEIEDLRQKAATLANELKAHVASTGEKLVGDRWQIVYTKPRVSWDTKALFGYAAAHPEIERFKKIGKPGASIRARK